MSQFWYCVKHKRVEPSEGCRNIDRLGPYDSQAAASRALESTEERNEEWDSDPTWNDDAQGRDRAEED